MTPSYDRISHAPKYWWKKEFGATYFNLYNPILSGQRAKAETQFIIRALGISRHMNILDLGCGHGRHTIELAKRGFRVTGLDYSDYFLGIARREAQKARIPVKFVKQDMRHLHLRNRYDVIISMYSAFGYFPHDENVDVLHRVFRALKPGGKFMIDIINAHAHVAYIRSHGKKLRKGVYQFTKHGTVDGYKLIDTNIYFETSQLDSYHRKWSKNNRKGSFNYYMYQYTLGQYKDMLERVGFRIENLFGEYSNAHWMENSWRTILVCTKPTTGVADINTLKRFINFSVLRRWPEGII